MRGTALIRAALAAAVLSLSTASLVSAAPPIYIQYRYVVDAITRVYSSPGAQRSTGIGCAGSCTTSIAETYGWSNSWSATITFAKAPIDAAVGYDSTQSGSRTHTQTFNVPAGKTGVIWYVDNYWVTEMNVHRESCAAGAGCRATEYGRAQARKWYERIYFLVLR